MMKYIYLKENFADHTVSAYSTLRGALRSENIDRVYFMARSYLKDGLKFSFKQISFTKIILNHGTRK